MANTLKITFTSIPQAEQYLRVRMRALDTGQIYNFDLTFKDQRVRRGEVPLTLDTPKEQATEFLKAWNYDQKDFYEQKGRPALQDVDGAVIIGNNLENSLGYVWEDVTGTALGSITYEIAGEPTVQKTFTAEVIKNTVDPCQFVDISIAFTGGTAPYKLWDNGLLLNPGVTSPFSYQVAKDGRKHTVSVVDSTGQTIGKAITLSTPRKLTSGDIDLEISSSSFGGTVKIDITYLNADLQPYTYSLDGTNYQSINQFTGLFEGTYTLYVKDAFDCVVTKTFIVTETTTVSEVLAEVSEVNPLRFAKVTSGKKNYYNTLSYQENREIANPFFQKWLLTDAPTTQFRTNAPYIRAYLTDCQGNETNLAVEQKIKNTGQTGYSEATLLSQSGKAALYYGNVALLDPATEAVTEYEDFGQFLPDWISEGQEVEVEGVGIVNVSEILFSADYNAYLAILDVNYTGATDTRKVKAIYNFNDTDVYEFVTIPTAIGDVYQVVIELGRASDDLTDIFISEPQTVVEDSDDLLKIEYSDTENRGGMNYQTGVSHVLRLEGYIEYEGEQATEGYKGDQQYYKTSDEIFNTHNVVLPHLTSALAHKARLILAHNNLIVDGLSVKLGEAPEIEGALTSNYKELRAKLQLSGNEFNKNQVENFIGDDETSLLSALEAYKDNGLLIYTRNTN